METVSIPITPNPLRVDKIIHTKTYHDKQCAAQVNGQISIGIRVGDITGAEQIHEGAPEYKAKKSQENPADQEHGKGVCHDLFGLFLVAESSGYRKEGSAAHAKQIGKCSDDCNDWKSQSDTGQCFCGSMGDMTDIDAVYHIVQDVNELS